MVTQCNEAIDTKLYQFCFIDNHSTKSNSHEVIGIRRSEIVHIFKIPHFTKPYNEFHPKQLQVLMFSHLKTSWRCVNSVHV